jgi:hypothetical protein
VNRGFGILACAVAVAVLLVACGSESLPMHNPAQEREIYFVPQVQFTPPVVKSGDEVRITGIGFALRTELKGFIAGPGTNEMRTAFADATSDSDGSFHLSVKLDPALTPGRYRVTFTNVDGSSMNGETPLVIVP